MRTKSALLNFITDFLPQILIVIIGMFKSKIWLEVMGQDITGLYQLYTQFITYLALAEGGLTSAALFRLYKPLADNDHEKVQRIVNATKVTFLCIGGIMLIIGFAISFVIPFMIQNNPFPSPYIQFNFMIYVVSEIVIYINIFTRIVYEADQKKYKINLIIQGTLILKGILEIIFIKIGGNLTSILIMFTILNIITNVIIQLMYRKEYKNLPKTKEKDFSLIKDVKNLMVHKIASLVANNIDTIIVSSVMGLLYVVIYTTYNTIVNSLKIVVDKIYGATTGGLGNLIAVDKEKSHSIFLEYNSVVFFLAIIMTIPLYFAIDYFINIWYKGQVATSILISTMFCLLFIYNTIRVPLNAYVSSAGLFKETRICPIIESIVNLVLSIIFVHIFGIVGVLAATVISLIVSEYLIKPIIIYKKIFSKKAGEYYIKNIKYIIFLTIMMLATLGLKLIYTPNGLLEWFISAGIIFIINLIITLIFFKFIKEDNFIIRIKDIILKKFKKTEEK